MIKFLIEAAVVICAGAIIFILWALCAAGKRRKKMIEIVDTKMTRADRIRNMTNEELAEFAFENEIEDNFHFCKNKEECDDMEGECREEECKKCMREWLEEEYEQS